MANAFILPKKRKILLEMADKSAILLDTPDENANVCCKHCAHATEKTLEQRLIIDELTSTDTHNFSSCTFAKVVYRCKFDPENTYRTHTSTCEHRTLVPDYVPEKLFVDPKKEMLRSEIKNARRIGVW